MNRLCEHPEEVQIAERNATGGRGVKVITREHVMPYVGKRVVVQTRDGAMHHGILHSVTNDGIYVRPLQGRARLAIGSSNQSAELLDKGTPSGADIEEAWWPFWFFPWWGIGGFWPWGWWW